MPPALSHQDLSDLIGRIYDSTLDPSRWEPTLADVADLLRCQQAVLHLNDVRYDCVLLHKGVGLDPHWLEKMGPYVPDMHSMLPSEPVLDEPHVQSRHVAPAVNDASPFVQEWMKPQGLVDIMQLFLLRTPTRFSGLGLSRHESVGVFGDRELELVRLLLPHVRRAVTISNVLDVQAIDKVRMADTLDALKVGVVLTNEDSRILHANRAAEAMMRDGGPLRDGGGVLRAEGAAASAEIKAAIALAARNESGIGRTGLAVRLTGEDEKAVVAHVLPLASGDIRTRLEPGSAAAVFINSVVDDAASATTVASMFGLTPAETRLLNRVLSGMAVAEAAADLEVAVTTARTHLNRIFAKTGVSRQSELMHLAARVAPPIRQDS